MLFLCAFFFFYLHGFRCELILKFEIFFYSFDIWVIVFCRIWMDRYELKVFQSLSLVSFFLSFCLFSVCVFLCLPLFPFEFFFPTHDSSCLSLGLSLSVSFFFLSFSTVLFEDLKAEQSDAFWACSDTVNRLQEGANISAALWLVLTWRRNPDGVGIPVFQTESSGRFQMDCHQRKADTWGRKHCWTTLWEAAHTLIYCTNSACKKLAWYKIR